MYDTLDSVVRILNMILQNAYFSCIGSQNW